MEFSPQVVSRVKSQAVSLSHGSDFPGVYPLSFPGDLWKSVLHFPPHLDSEHDLMQLFFSRFHRSTIRPFFNKDRIADFENFERHAQASLDQAQARLNEGFSVDMQVS